MPELRTACSGLRLASCRLQFHLLDHFIDEPVFHRLGRGHEGVAVGVFFDLFERLTGVIEEDFVELFFCFLVLGGVDHDVLGGTLHAGGRLVDHDSRVGQRVTFASSAGSEEQRAHRGSLA